MAIDLLAGVDTASEQRVGGKVVGGCFAAMCRLQTTLLDGSRVWVVLRRGVDVVRLGEN